MYPFAEAKDELYLSDAFMRLDASIFTESTLPTPFVYPLMADKFLESLIPPEDKVKEDFVSAVETTVATTSAFVPSVKLGNEKL
jgi:hypothetical protein